MPLGILLIPFVQNPASAEGATDMFTFDVTNFNDTQSAGFYTWKMEDVMAGRTPTIREVYVSYRDLGKAQVTFTLTGTNDLQEIVSETVTLEIGNVSPTGRIMTVNSGIPSLTGQNLQLRMDRAANGGPVSITKIRCEGTIEETVY